MIRLTALMCVIPLLAGCAVTEPSCAGDSALVGSWRYSAIQESPAATLAGTLAITESGCGLLIGQLDVTETRDLGGTSRLAGVVTGSILANGTVRFEAELAGGTRQHLATLVGDSLDGSWAVTGGELAASGRFGGHRK